MTKYYLKDENENYILDGREYMMEGKELKRIFKTKQHALQVKEKLKENGNYELIKVN
jgi:hypothetical protein